MYEIKCGEVWGGIRGADLEARTSGIAASLFSRPQDGGKGGDIYYISVCNNDLITRIAIADVVGHGEAISDTSKWLYSSLAQRMNEVGSAVVLADLNQLALDCGYKAITTAVVCGFFRKTNELFFSSAGHHPLLVRTKATGNWVSTHLPDTPSLANLPLGVDVDCAYDQSIVPLQSGDQLFLYTDGLVEARNPQREPFGIERLVAALGAVGGDHKAVKQAVLEAVMRHADGERLRDDVTFMAVQIR